jgi:hypothetical protein
MLIIRDHIAINMENVCQFETDLTRKNIIYFELINGNHVVLEFDNEHICKDIFYYITDFYKNY